MRFYFNRLPSLFWELHPEMELPQPVFYTGLLSSAAQLKFSVAPRVF
jgi:hypothetical protein